MQRICKPISFFSFWSWFDHFAIGDSYDFVHLDFVYHLIIHDGWWKFDKNRPIYKKWRKKKWKKKSPHFGTNKRNRLFKFILKIMVKFIFFFLYNCFLFSILFIKRQTTNEKKERNSYDIWSINHSHTKTNWNALSIWINQGFLIHIRVCFISDICYSLVSSLCTVHIS